MISSRTVTLFTEPPPVRTGPSAFVISILLHGVVCGLILVGISRAPRTTDAALARRYTVRLLTLHQPERRQRLSAPAPAEALHAAAASHAAAGSAPSARAAVPQIAHPQVAQQTLVQPDLPQNLLLPHETPIPTVLMWSADNSTARVIVAPPLQALTAVRVHPLLEIPNREVNLADVRISSSTLVTHAISLPPSTTAPIMVEAAKVTEQIPSSAAKPVGAPTPARVLSLSDLEMPEGTVALPQSNQTAASSAIGFALGHGLAPVGTGDGTSEGKSGVGSGQGNERDKQGNGAAGDAVASAGSGTAAGRSGDGTAGGTANGTATGTANGAANGTVNGAANGTHEGDSEPAIAHLKLRKDGKFGVVVVGSSIAEAYPETAGIWGGRLAYTVYLHVGLPKTWILQYALPRDAEGTVAGNITRPDAPWPYDMARPHLAPEDFNANAVMVHGIVNAAGRFEKLGVVFPLEFAQAKFLLSALEQWQFRPAMQNGQIAAVEVLLIIPEETE